MTSTAPAAILECRAPGSLEARIGQRFTIDVELANKGGTATQVSIAVDGQAVVEDLVAFEGISVRRHRSSRLARNDFLSAAPLSFVNGFWAAVVPVVVLGPVTDRVPDADHTVTLEIGASGRRSGEGDLRIGVAEAQTDDRWEPVVATVRLRIRSAIDRDEVSA